MTAIALRPEVFRAVQRLDRYGKGGEAFSCIGEESARYVVRDEKMLRPSDIECSYADVRKAEKTLGWRAKNKMSDVVRFMLEAELALSEAEGHPWQSARNPKLRRSLKSTA
jgi:GDP-D-mannose dehydratase